MSDTRPNIPLPANVQVDIYAALNAQVGFPAVTVGTKIIFQNRGSVPVYVTTKATTPDVADGEKTVKPEQQAFNEDGDSGAWVLSPIVDGIINAGVSV